MMLKKPICMENFHAQAVFLVFNKKEFDYF